MKTASLPVVIFRIHDPDCTWADSEVVRFNNTNASEPWEISADVQFLDAVRRLNAYLVFFSLNTRSFRIVSWLVRESSMYCYSMHVCSDLRALERIPFFSATLISSNRSVTLAKFGLIFFIFECNLELSKGLTCIAIVALECSYIIL